MSASLFGALVTLTLISSVAILIVGALRRPLRAMVGARAAYWIWSLVPASMLVLLLPAPERGEMPTEGGFSIAVLPTVLPPAEIILPTSFDYEGLVIVLWAAGAVLAAFFMARRHRKLVESLQADAIGPDGVRLSAANAGPMIL